MEDPLLDTDAKINPGVILSVVAKGKNKVLTLDNKKAIEENKKKRMSVVRLTTPKSDTKENFQAN